MLAYTDFAPAQASSSLGHSDTQVQLTYPNEQKKQPLMPLRITSEVSVPKKPINVIRFHVWQDLTASHGGSDPLYATLTIEMPDAHYLNLSAPNGFIKIEGNDGESIAEAKLLINQAHYGLGLTQPGTRQVQFAMSPVPMYGRLDKVEMVRGSARIRIGERMVTVSLPETSVIYAR